MGKGSATRPFSDSVIYEDIWVKIFGKKKNISDDTSPHLVEYELNKSTGALQKVDDGN